MDLAKEVTCRQTYEWAETVWDRERGYGLQRDPRYHVVAIDYGAKRNILRMLAAHGCRVTVVPATASTEDVLRHRPDGIFLSNGPGDPAATGSLCGAGAARSDRLRASRYSASASAISCWRWRSAATTRKMPRGHRGANHPVKDLLTGKVEITSQNHGFVVDPESLPRGVEPTHLSLFDNTNEGLRIIGKPVFSVQYHPEASPGPAGQPLSFRAVCRADGRECLGAPTSTAS